MKFAGARGITRTRVPLIAMLALAATIGLAGCEGDDGKDGLAGTPGTPGTPGATGPIGPTGPTGPVGPSATIEPRESCGVCHANGSAYGVAESHPVAADITVSNLTFAVSGTNLVISYNLKTNGANAANFLVLRSDYRFDGTTRIDLSDSGSAVTLAGGPRCPRVARHAERRVRTEDGRRSGLLDLLHHVPDLHDQLQRLPHGKQWRAGEGQRHAGHGRELLQLP